MITRLSLVILITTSHIRSAAVNTPNPALQDRVYIADYDGYRKINYKDQQLLIYSQDNAKAIFYLSKQFSQSYIETPQHQEWNFQVDSKNKKHKITFKDNKVSYYTVNKTIYYNSFCTENLLKNITGLNEIDFVDLVGEVTDNNINNILEDSCKNNEVFSSSFQNVVETERTNLTKCHDSIQKLIGKDKNIDTGYLNYFGNVYSKYHSFVKELEDGQKPLTLSCDLKENEIRGSLDERTTPPKISFNLDLLLKNAKTSESIKEEEIIANISETLRHELFHYGQPVQDASLEVSKCVNEAFTTIFTNTCKSVQHMKAKYPNDPIEMRNAKINVDIDQYIKDNIKSSKFITDTCKDNTNYKVKLSSDGKIDYTPSTADVGEQGQIGTATANLQASQSLASQQAQAATQQKLQETVSKADYAAITNDTFAQLTQTMTAGTTKGKEYSIPANSAGGKATLSAMNSFNSSSNSLAAKYNAAAGAFNTQAQANTTSEVTSLNQANTTTRNIASVNANNSNALEATTKEKTSLVASKVQPSGGSNTTTLNNTDATTTSLPQATSDLNTASIPTTNPDNTPVSPTTSAATTTTVTATPAAANQAQQNPSPSRQPAAVNAQNAPEIRMARSLRSMNEYTGRSYDSIRALYNNTTFKNTLNNEKIRIDVLDANGNQLFVNGKPVQIGYTDNSKGAPTRVFKSNDAKRSLQSSDSNQ